MHTPNHHCTHTHMHALHMHKRLYAYTLVCTHTPWHYLYLSVLEVMNSYKLCHVSCSMLATTVTEFTPFSLFLYLGLNKENVCPVCHPTCPTHLKSSTTTSWWVIKGWHEGGRGAVRSGRGWHVVSLTSPTARAARGAGPGVTLGSSSRCQEVMPIPSKITMEKT